MFHRALARRRVLQHARRTLFACAAGSLLLTISPVASWNFQDEIPQPATAPRPLSLAEINHELSLGPFNSLRRAQPVEPEPVTISTDLPWNLGPLSGMRTLGVARHDFSIGQAIVDFAMAYLGYPYIYAGAGPYGFDCSGFTQFVVGNVTGIWISHAVEAQPYFGGTWVEYGAWQPGDLIYFQNTYKAGVSHAAIYIGDGLIIHAENPGSGVTIDSIYSGYYGPRYWGAIRIGG